MSGMIISFFIAVLSFNFFIISYQINGVNRLVLGAPSSLYEAAINLFDLNEGETPYFDKEILYENINHYFAYSMPRFTNDYEIGLYYYNPSDGSICLEDKCYAVEVTIKATLSLNYKYQRTMFYEIRSELWI